MVLQSNSIAHQKKAQGLSINTIILITLGVIVLLVLIYIFTGSAGTYRNETADIPSNFKASICALKGGTCSEERPGEGYVDIKDQLPPNDKVWKDCSTKCWKKP